MTRSKESAGAHQDPGRESGTACACVRHIPVIGLKRRHLNPLAVASHRRSRGAPCPTGSCTHGTKAPVAPRVCRSPSAELSGPSPGERHRALRGVRSACPPPVFGARREAGRLVRSRGTAATSGDHCLLDDFASKGSAQKRKKRREVPEIGDRHCGLGPPELEVRFFRWRPPRREHRLPGRPRCQPECHRSAKHHPGSAVSSPPPPSPGCPCHCRSDEIGPFIVVLAVAAVVRVSRFLGLQAFERLGFAAARRRRW